MVLHASFKESPQPFQAMFPTITAQNLAAALLAANTQPQLAAAGTQPIPYLLQAEGYAMPPLVHDLYALMNVNLQAMLRTNIVTPSKTEEIIEEKPSSSFSIESILKVEDGSSHNHQASTSPASSSLSDVTAYTIDALEVADGRAKSAKKKDESSLSGRCVCDQCGKSYATTSNLSRHKQTHRSLDSPHAKQCPHCDRVYVSMPALSMHILTHKASHECHVCGKMFSRLWLLQGHLRSHTGQRPFGCAHCGKTFADRSNLRAHILTHTGEKRHSCARCGKRFALRSYLTRHLETSCRSDAGVIKELSPPMETILPDESRAIVRMNADHPESCLVKEEKPFEGYPDSFLEAFRCRSE